jgi:hypothetical protein
VPSLGVTVLLTVSYVRPNILIASVPLVFAFEQLDGLVLPRVRE